MKKSIFIITSVLSFSIAQGETFFLGENQFFPGIDPYYSIGLQYLGNGTFVGAGTGSKPRPRDYIYQRMFYKNGEELPLNNLNDMTYQEFPKQCLPQGHEDEVVFVYYDSLNNLDINATEVTVPATGNATIYHTQNLQLPAHPVVTVGSFIPRFPQDAKWESHLSYKQLSEEGKEILLDNGFTIPANKLNIESTVRHYDDSELNPEKTMHTPSAFLDYDQTKLYALGGDSSNFGKTGQGGVVIWGAEYIARMTILQPYAWWIEAMQERRTLPIDLALEILQDSNKAQLACDPSNYIASGINPNTNIDDNTTSPSSGGGLFSFEFLYLIGFLNLIAFLRKRKYT